MTLDEITATLHRIEAKLDTLIAALAEDADDEDPPQLTLDGTPAGAARDATQSL